MHKAIDSAVDQGQHERRTVASSLRRLLESCFHPHAEVERLKEEVLGLARERWNPDIWPISLHKEELVHHFIDSVEDVCLVNYKLQVGTDIYGSGDEISDIRALKVLRDWLS